MIPTQSKFPLERVDVFISVCKNVGELKTQESRNVWNIILRNLKNTGYNLSENFPSIEDSRMLRLPSIWFWC